MGQKVNKFEKMVLFSTVRFDHHDEVMVVKTKFIHGMKSASIMNVGSQRKKHRIFYSPNSRATPDFSLEICEVFDATKTACYYGYVLRTFGKYYSY